MTLLRSWAKTWSRLFRTVVTVTILSRWASSFLILTTSTSSLVSKVATTATIITSVVGRARLGTVVLIISLIIIKLSSGVAVAVTWTRKSVSYIVTAVPWLVVMRSTTVVWGRSLVSIVEFVRSTAAISQIVRRSVGSTLLSNASACKAIFFLFSWTVAAILLVRIAVVLTLTVVVVVVSLAHFFQLKISLVKVLIN